MATLNDVLKLQGTVPGINITQTIDSYSKKPIIRISFRKAAFEGGQRSTLDPRQFDYTMGRGARDALALLVLT